MRTIPVIGSLTLFLASLFVAINLQKPLAGLIILIVSLLTLWLEVSHRDSQEGEHHVR